MAKILEMFVFKLESGLLHLYFTSKAVGNMLDYGLYCDRLNDICGVCDAAW
jgi:hypothetical protein